MIDPQLAHFVSYPTAIALVVFIAIKSLQVKAAVSG
jgi:hypothetical protein